MLSDQVLLRIEKYFGWFILTLTASLSLYLFIWELNHQHELKNIVTNNSLTTKYQYQILKGYLFIFIAISISVYGILIKFKNDQIKLAINSFLKIISILFIIPIILHKDIWRAYPFIMIVLVSLFSLYLVLIVNKNNVPSLLLLKESSNISKIITYVILILLIVGYAWFFSYYTILNHNQLRTQTYDFGFFQNAFVNTLHGHFMGISYPPFNGDSLFRNHLGFIWICYLPFFYFFPKAETLLILQSITIAIAALPLFLLSKETLKSNFASLIIASIFLLHPANHGANFYDIHQTSFIPLVIFSIFYFLEKKNTFAFITSILLLLSIKFDMCLLLFPIALFIYFNNKKNLKFATYCFLASALYGIVFIFIGKKYLLESFFPYYEGMMVKKSGGLEEIIKTFITNPMYLVNTLMTRDRILFFCQLFGPLLFIPLMRKNNYLIFIYGLTITLLAKRQEIHEICFHYVWCVLPFLFIGLIYVLKDVQTNNNVLIKILKNNITLLITTIFLTSLIYSWQYGAVLNKQYFKGGFWEINFKFSEKDKKRLQMLNDIIVHIPPNVSIQTAIDITPHLLKHEKITLIEDTTSPKADYLLLHYPNIENPIYFESLKSNRAYKIVYQNLCFQLLKKI